MLDQLRQIAIFARTVEHGSFRKAADALQLSPSVISHHVAQLERRLGVALLYRSTRKLSLTSDGKKLLVSAQAMINAAETFISVASRNTPQLMGHLNVTLPAVMERSAVVNHIGDFVKSHPDVSLQIEFSDVRREIIQDGIDLAIRMGWLSDSNLKARKLGEVNRHVVASPGLLKTLKKPISPKDLETLNWVELFPVGLRQVFGNPKGSKVTIKPKSQIRVSNAYAVLQLVENENGIGVLPEFLIQSDETKGKLVRILTNWKLKPIGVYAVWPSNAPKDGLTKRLVEFLANRNILT